MTTVLYFNIFDYPSRGEYVHRMQEHPADLIESYYNWTFVDTILHAHFNNSFWERVDVMGREDFLAETEDFSTMLDETLEVCEDLVKEPENSTTTFDYPATKWNPPFVMTRTDCVYFLSKSGIRKEYQWRYGNDTRPVEQPIGPARTKFWC